jgi:heme exporter protein D
MSGTVTGGWGYVWLAYGATATIFLFYTISVIRRYTLERNRDDRNTANPEVI